MPFHYRKAYDDGPRKLSDEHERQRLALQTPTDQQMPKREQSPERSVRISTPGWGRGFRRRAVVRGLLPTMLLCCGLCAQHDGARLSGPLSKATHLVGGSTLASDRFANCRRTLFLVIKYKCGARNRLIANSVIDSGRASGSRLPTWWGPRVP